MANIGQDRAQFVPPIRTGREQEVGGIGVAQNRAEGLVDLVGDGARQLPGDREARGMGELAALLMDGLFHAAATTAFEQEPGD